MNTHSFFALMSRMKYVNRWSLMRNAHEESLSEHSLETAMIAHALCVIGNVRYGKSLDVSKAALVGIYHDAAEIITGDMPTPVKYSNENIRDTYKEVEAKAEQSLINHLPDDLKPMYHRIFESGKSKGDRYMRKLVKAADKISAYIKCVEEEESGNKEFRNAKETLSETIEEMRKEMPEVNDFVNEFMPAYGLPLDSLLKEA